MFHNIQCSTSSVPVPIAASVSRAINTKLCTPSGTLLHASGGDPCAPACVYFAGIVPPSAQLYQFNVLVPAGLAPGDHPVAVQMNGISSPSTDACCFLTVQ